MARKRILVRFLAISSPFFSVFASFFKLNIFPLFPYLARRNQTSSRFRQLFLLCKPAGGRHTGIN